MSLKVKVYHVGQMVTNCCLVFDDNSKEVVIIDPGDDAEFIADEVKKHQLKPEAIIATHGHFDHIMAVSELKLMYKIPFLVSKEDEFLVKKMKESAWYFIRVSTGPIPKVDRYIKEGDEIKIGEEKIKVIDLPGHSPGGVCLYSKKICKNKKLRFGFHIDGEDAYFCQQLKKNNIKLYANLNSYNQHIMTQYWLNKYLQNEKIT